MRILILAVDYNGCFMPFVEEQISALRKCDVEILRFAIHKKGFIGYLHELKTLNQIIKKEQPDIIHAHYGLCGLLANLQRQVPVVTTFHGSDINNTKVLYLSKIAIYLSAWSVFVAKSNMDIAKPRRKCSLLPCGVNLDDLALHNESFTAPAEILLANKKHILFAGSFRDQVKDPTLAKNVIDQLNEEYKLDVQLIELRGYTRQEVTYLMHTCDALLMTSKSEGSPQVIKEAMACNCPIVSVDVGDVRERLSGLQGCCVVASRNVNELATSLFKVLLDAKRTNGRERIIEMGLTNDLIAKRLVEIYNNVLLLE